MVSTWGRSGGGGSGGVGGGGGGVPPSHDAASTSRARKNMWHRDTKGQVRKLDQQTATLLFTHIHKSILRGSSKHRWKRFIKVIFFATQFALCPCPGVLERRVPDIELRAVIQVPACAIKCVPICVATNIQDLSIWIKLVVMTCMTASMMT